MPACRLRPEPAQGPTASCCPAALPQHSAVCSSRWQSSWSAQTTGVRPAAACWLLYSDCGDPAACGLQMRGCRAGRWQTRSLLSWSLPPVSARDLLHALAEQLLAVSELELAADVLGVPLGQWLMRNRKPYSMKTVSVLHNIFMFVLSLWMTYETLTQVGLFVQQAGSTSGTQCAAA